MKIIVNNKESYYSACREIQKQCKEHGIITIEISQDVKRSTAQNSYSHALYKLMGEHCGQSVSTMKAWAKLQIGVKILMEHEEKKDELKKFYREKILTLEYADQIEYLIIHETPLTSKLGKKQMAMFLDELTSRALAQGLKIPSMIDYGLNKDWELING